MMCLVFFVDVEIFILKAPFCEAKRRGLGARPLAVRGGGSATREKIRSIGSAQRVRERGDYIFEWAFQIPPPQPKKHLKSLISGVFFMQSGVKVEFGSFFYFRFDPILIPESVNFL